MQQINTYTVQYLGVDETNILNNQDAGLIKSYTLGNISFYPDKYTVNLEVHDLDDNYVETATDLTSYSIPGSVQAGKATEISVNVIQDIEDLGYLGDVILQYDVFNNLFSPSRNANSEAYLYVSEISTDRTEVRTRSTSITDSDLKGYVEQVYSKLNDQVYFPAIYLDFFESDSKAVITNILTEVVDSVLYVTFKLYEPLSDSIDVKSKFYVQERIGEPSKFQIIRNVEIVEDVPPQLRGPNFNVDSEEIVSANTDYLTYDQLFSYPISSSYSQLYTFYNQSGASVSIDHSDFSSFVHFSSAAERLQNFRYKLTLIKGYEYNIELLTELNVGDPNIKKNQDLITGIIKNFDHYDQYLYFESGSTAWPKSNQGRPYINVDPEDSSIQTWWDNIIAEAETYDEFNADGLVNTIPQTIRDDSRNAGYVAFVHMIGQHFDDEWVYAKAITDRYNADNRLDFGISKDLVWNAIKDFGINLYSTNQNLDTIFSNCNLDGNTCYSTGSESSIKVLYRLANSVSGSPVPIYITTNNYDGGQAKGVYATWSLTGVVADGEQADSVYTASLDGGHALWSLTGVVANGGEAGSGVYTGLNGGYALWSLTGVVANGGEANTEAVDRNEFQPILSDSYHKEVYKRIYHNLPLLLKTKGTERGLRALINCFGIPDDILKISVLGGTKIDGNFTNVSTGTSSSLDRIRLDNTGSIIPFLFSGSFVTSSQLHTNVPIRTKKDHYTDSSQEIEVGFSLNKQFNDLASSTIGSTFDYDDIVGDPRNTKENYGNSFSNIFNQLLAGNTGSLNSLRSPLGIIRLVRYFDSTLFKSLGEFLPARASVSTGVIVEDNVLHRNRYAGFNSYAQNIQDLEGPIEMMYIDGGSGESFKYTTNHKAGESTKLLAASFRVYGHTITSSVSTTNHYQDWSTGNFVGKKAIFDDSAEYTGELSGSIKEITDGELNKPNTYKKAGGSQVSYRLNYKFLCLPENGNLYCTLLSSAFYRGLAYGITSYSGNPVYGFSNSNSDVIDGNGTDGIEYNGGTSTGDETGSIIEGGSSVINSAYPYTVMATNEQYGYVYIPTGYGGATVSASIDADRVFLGWYSGVIPDSNGTPYYSQYLSSLPTYIITGSAPENITIRTSNISYLSPAFVLSNGSSPFVVIHGINLLKDAFNSITFSFDTDSGNKFTFTVSSTDLNTIVSAGSVSVDVSATGYDVNVHGQITTYGIVGISDGVGTIKNAEYIYDLLGKLEHITQWI